MPAFVLAEINIARLLHPLDHPQIADFVAELKPVNELADRSEGFIWRLQSSAGDATDIGYSDDPFIILNMSVWTTPEALRAFVYRSGHVEVFRKRASWFEKPQRAPYCLWWVPCGHIPSVEEGRDRLEHYWEHGPTPEAFWFNVLFPAPADIANRL
jgi:hypothetical protein